MHFLYTPWSRKYSKASSMDQPATQLPRDCVVLLRKDLPEAHTTFLYFQPSFLCMTTDAEAWGNYLFLAARKLSNFRWWRFMLLSSTLGVVSRRSHWQRVFNIAWSPRIFARLLWLNNYNANNRGSDEGAVRSTCWRWRQETRRPVVGQVSEIQVVAIFYTKASTNSKL